MSISFWAVDSPKAADKVFECMYADSKTKKCVPQCPECNGTGEVRFDSYEYDVNFSNANGWQLTGILNANGVPDYSGSLQPAEIPAAIERMKKLSNDDYRKTAMLKILRWARDNYKEVCWG